MKYLPHTWKKGFNTEGASMLEATKPKTRTATLYLTAWLAYIVFSILAFPVFGITVMLFSITLAVAGAWLYGYGGAVVTTVLTVPYHYLLLSCCFGDRTLLNEAFNPFGISTQLLVAGAVVAFRSAQERIERLNLLLERKVEKRTEELNRLQRYIIQNYETRQSTLCHTLLDDIGKSLSDMLEKSEKLLNRLVAENDPEVFNATRLNELVNNSLHTIQNMEFEDRLIANDETSFVDALSDLIDHLRETTGTHFDFKCHIGHREIKKNVQQQLYCITREAVVNAIRHARANKVDIELHADRDNCQLNIVNDGLPMPTNVEEGLGMKLMRRRAQQLGGYIGWDTTPEGKTSVQCDIPQPFD